MVEKIDTKQEQIRFIRHLKKEYPSGNCRPEYFTNDYALSFHFINECIKKLENGKELLEPADPTVILSKGDFLTVEDYFRWAVANIQDEKALALIVMECIKGENEVKKLIATKKYSLNEEK